VPPFTCLLSEAVLIIARPLHAFPAKRQGLSADNMRAKAAAKWGYGLLTLNDFAG
jgi:hypothetical protein